MKTISKSGLNQLDQQMVSVMQALGDKTRFQMFKLLASERNMCVSEIAAELNISVPAVSQHFRIFELIGLVSKKRDGQKICYAIRSDNQLIDELKNLMEENNG